MKRMGEVVSFVWENLHTLTSLTGKAGISTMMQQRGQRTWGLKVTQICYTRMSTFHPQIVSMTSKDSPVFVYQCIEGHAVPPASGEIVNVDVGVPNKHEAQDKSDTIIK